MELSLWYLECRLHPGWALLGKQAFLLTYVLFSFLCNFSTMSVIPVGWSIIPNSWKFGAPCNDGKSPWTTTPAYVEESRVSCYSFFSPSDGEANMKPNANFFYVVFSRHADKYVRRGRLDWPEGAASRDSIKAVLKLPRLQNLIMQHVDHSAGDLINLLQGLLKYEPSERMTAEEALRHPFFTRDHLRRYWIPWMIGTGTEWCVPGMQFVCLLRCTWLVYEVRIMGLIENA